jgi:flagellar hook protein FlgE
VFKSALKEGSAVDGKVVDPRRVKVPFMDLPGLAITYEATIDDAEQGKMPYYLYLAAVDVKTADPLRSAAGRGSAPGKTGGKAASRGSDRMDESGALYESLKRAFPKTTSNNWQDVQCPTPDGGEVTWQKIRATGDQVFYYVDSTGRVTAGKAAIGQFRVVEFADKENQLVPVGSSCFSAPKDVRPKDAASVIVQQGYEEASNVKLVDELVNMIKVSRLYEANMKMTTVNRDNTSSVIGVAMG